MPHLTLPDPASRLKFLRSILGNNFIIAMDYPKTRGTISVEAITVD